LASRPWGQIGSISVLPELPESGHLGFRRRLSSHGFGDFNEKRQEGLQRYMEALLAHVCSVRDDLDLERFFVKSPSPIPTTEVASPIPMLEAPPCRHEGHQRLLDSLIASCNLQTKSPDAQGAELIRAVRKAAACRP
jgi:hypothetical protein